MPISKQMGRPMMDSQIVSLSAAGVYPPISIEVINNSKIALLYIGREYIGEMTSRAEVFFAINIHCPGRTDLDHIKQQLQI